MCSIYGIHLGQARDVLVRRNVEYDVCCTCLSCMYSQQLQHNLSFWIRKRAYLLNPDPGSLNIGFNLYALFRLINMYNYASTSSAKHSIVIYFDFTTFFICLIHTIHISLKCHNVKKCT